MRKKTGNALVVGAGIAGIRSALDLAELGYGVTLIDSSDHVGGVLSQLDRQFPSDHCGMCKMLPMIERDDASQECLRRGLSHQNIDLRLSTSLVAVDGESGSFQTTIQSRPDRIDPVRCLGCGLCVDVCPVEVPDVFNGRLARRKAVYSPTPHAAPHVYRIDLEACTLCGECEKVCPTQAIQLADTGRRLFHILVVDDELIVRDSLKEWLDDVGFSVDMAASGPEALEKLEQHPFDLLLVDIKMPGMDGVEVLRRAKDRDPDLIVIMITAYGTIDTAVEAMKIGAVDYLTKPFDPERLVPMVEKIYQSRKAPGRETLEVGTIILACGADYVDPALAEPLYGYGRLPDVVTGLEFERLLSGSGSTGGKLVRPSDGRPVRKVAWLQCVGSRTVQAEAGFCSSVCCMYAVKEARLAKEKIGPELDASIFYMDMRTFGQRFQRYRDEAEADGVRFIRSRVHTVDTDPVQGGLSLSFVEPDGAVQREPYDMVVLSVGARPAAATGELAEMLNLTLNQWGFPETEAFHTVRSSRAGVFLSGSSAGLRDIGDSVMQAGAASLEASRTLHSGGKGLAAVGDEATFRDVSREPVRPMAVICRCRRSDADGLDWEGVAQDLRRVGRTDDVLCLDDLCTAQGWDRLVEAVGRQAPNRLLLGACLQYADPRKLRQLGRATQLDPGLMSVVDVHTSLWSNTDRGKARAMTVGALAMALARTRRIDPVPGAGATVDPGALVLGGGIAGMTAALMLADHGVVVELVEQDGRLGGNLNWLTHTLEEGSTAELLAETMARVERHPNIHVHLSTRVIASDGRAGRMRTVIEDSDGRPRTLSHAVTILAVGGSEGPVDDPDRSRSNRVVTQREFEEGLTDGRIDPAALTSVVMIQCAGTRTPSRNYCSRICCASSLKHALHMKSRNPDLSAWILHRDMMTPGFTESQYLKARQAGVIFVNYDLPNKPAIKTDGDKTILEVFDPILRRGIEIDADLIVLAAGVVSGLDAKTAGMFGAELDEDGFFLEAESKWRPVDALREGVFACGLALSPRNISDTISSAKTAAQRALRILVRETLPASRVVARVRQALCARCERCVEVCPYQARYRESESGAIVVDSSACQGCGNCAAVCPNSATVLSGFEDAGLLDAIDTALETAWASER